MDNETPSAWSDMPIDLRIIEALKDLKWAAPTPIQSASIAQALKGKDVAIHSRTGSGKTGAFVIPAIQRIITERSQSSKKGSCNPVAVLLLPSVELCEQTVEVTKAISKFVKPRLVIDNLTTHGAVTSLRFNSAHVVVCTVALFAKCCKNQIINADTLKSVRYLVLDEADMIASSSEHSLRIVYSVLPQSLQVILASATLTEALATVKGQLLHNPVNISLTSQELPNDTVSEVDANGPVVESRITLKEAKNRALKQYYLVSTDICHEHTLLYGLYRLKLIEGKTLIFVNNMDETYKLQHFLEMMGIGTLVYDANLPLNARLDTLRRFQRGQVTTLVCTDGTLEKAEQLYAESANANVVEKENQKSKKRARESTEDNEVVPSALHRGVDFSDVKNVILFNGVDTNSPLQLSKYTHRIGRAGRAGREGLAITIFSVPQARVHLQPLRSYVEGKGDRLVPFKQLQRSEATKLQYRVDTVLANVTRASTRKLRVASVAAELNKSSFLNNHLAEKDSEALQKILKKSRRKVAIQKSVLEIPEYMKVKKAEDVKEYTHRVRLDQTRASKYKKATQKTSEDPLKAVVTKLRHRKK